MIKCTLTAGRTEQYLVIVEMLDRNDKKTLAIGHYKNGEINVYGHGSVHILRYLFILNRQ